MKQPLSSQDNNTPDWMVVYNTSNFSEAHLVAGRLQSKGIEPYIHAQPGASAMGITLGTFGNIAVLVRPPDYEAAMDLLFPDEPDELPDNTADWIIVDDDDLNDD